MFSPRLFVGPILAVLLGGAAAPPEDPPCFTGRSDRAPDIEIFQQAPPPLPARQSRFNYFPATAFATQSMERIWQAGRTNYQLYYFQWANRSTQGVIDAKGARITRKGNFQPGLKGALDQRTGFTSTEKADACTLAQTAAVLGRPQAEIDERLRVQGLQGVRPPGESQAGIADASDICVLPPRPLPIDSAGVLLDYEVQDGRTPAYSLDFLKRFADLVHGAGKHAVLLIDPFDAPTQIYTGISAANANAIHRLFDRTTVFVWSRNAQGDIGKSLVKQMEILQAGGAVEPGRLIIDFELANTSQRDAKLVRNFIEDHHLAGVFFWRNQARQGGSCMSEVNQKIACIALGACADSR